SFQLFPLRSQVSALSPHRSVLSLSVSAFSFELSAFTPSGLRFQPSALFRSQPSALSYIVSSGDRMVNRIKYDPVS
ncbi:MAG TPA: hypothetical protein DGF30_08410, partial [Desulfomicrobium sp.]|nr:hypothetical protein [Desulfomicrobium sp.]